jgi:cysteine-rich repeat protein
MAMVVMPPASKNPAIFAAPANHASNLHAAMARGHLTRRVMTETTATAMAALQLVWVEEGFRCSTAGCTSVCGDSKIRGEETCDDGNRNGGDGCSSVCRKEPYYDCPVVGELCVSNISCGNGVLEPGEVCDPGLSGSTTCDSTGSDACKRFDSEFVDPPYAETGPWNTRKRVMETAGSAGARALAPWKTVTSAPGQLLLSRACLWRRPPPTGRRM